MPFSAGSLGGRFGALVYNFAEAVVALARNIPISQINFSQISITADGDVGGQGVAKSGVRLYTRLPVFNGANLEDFCPRLGPTQGQPRRASRGTMSKATASDKIPAIILMSLQVAVVLVAAIGVESRSSPPPTLTEQPWDNSTICEGMYTDAAPTGSEAVTIRPRQPV